eukprot:gene6355-2984_t
MVIPEGTTIGLGTGVMMSPADGDTGTSHHEPPYQPDTQAMSQTEANGPYTKKSPIGLAWDHELSQQLGIQERHTILPPTNLDNAANVYKKNPHRLGHGSHDEPTYGDKGTYNTISPPYQPDNLTRWQMVVQDGPPSGLGNVESLEPADGDIRNVTITPPYPTPDTQQNGHTSGNVIPEGTTIGLGTGVIMSPADGDTGTSHHQPPTNLTPANGSYQKQMVIPEGTTIGLGTGVIMSPADGDTGTSHHQPPYQPDTQLMVIPEGTTIGLGTGVMMSPQRGITKVPHHRFGTGVMMSQQMGYRNVTTMTPLTTDTQLIVIQRYHHRRLGTEFMMTQQMQMSYKESTIGLGMGVMMSPQMQMVIPEESTIGLGTGVMMSPADGDTGTSHHQPPYQPDTQQMVIPEGTTIGLWARESSEPSRGDTVTSHHQPPTNLTAANGSTKKQMVVQEESTIGLGMGVMMSPADGDTGTSHHQPPYQPDTQQMSYRGKCQTKGTTIAWAPNGSHDEPADGDTGRHPMSPPLPPDTQQWSSREMGNHGTSHHQPPYQPDNAEQMVIVTEGPTIRLGHGSHDEVPADGDTERTIAHQEPPYQLTRIYGHTELDQERQIAALIKEARGDGNAGRRLVSANNPRYLDLESRPVLFGDNTRQTASPARQSGEDALQYLSPLLLLMEEIGLQARMSTQARMSSQVSSNRNSGEPSADSEGLGSSVITRNADMGKRLAERRISAQPSSVAATIEEASSSALVAALRDRLAASLDSSVIPNERVGLTPSPPNQCHTAQPPSGPVYR